MAMTRSEPAGAGRKGTLIVAAALLALPLLLSGCAQSAFNACAQNSAAIAPSDRPPALSVFSVMADERDDAVQ